MRHRGKGEVLDRRVLPGGAIQLARTGEIPQGVTMPARAVLTLAEVGHVLRKARLNPVDDLDLADEHGEFRAGEPSVPVTVYRVAVQPADVIPARLDQLEARALDVPRQRLQGAQPARNVLGEGASSAYRPFTTSRASRAVALAPKPSGGGPVSRRTIAFSLLARSARPYPRERQPVNVPEAGFEHDVPEMPSRIAETKFPVAPSHDHAQPVRGERHGVEREVGLGLARDALAASDVPQDHLAARRHGRHPLSRGVEGDGLDRAVLDSERAQAPTASDIPDPDAGARRAQRPRGVSRRDVEADRDPRSPGADGDAAESMTWLADLAHRLAARRFDRAQRRLLAFAIRSVAPSGLQTSPTTSPLGVSMCPSTSPVAVSREVRRRLRRGARPPTRLGNSASWPFCPATASRPPSGLKASALVHGSSVYAFHLSLPATRSCSVTNRQPAVATKRPSDETATTEVSRRGGVGIVRGRASVAGSQTRLA